MVTVLGRSRDIYCYMLSAKFLYLVMREKVCLLQSAIADVFTVPMIKSKSL